MSNRVLIALLLAVACNPLAAQSPGGLDAASTSLHGCGLHVDDDGNLLGLGADYQVRFFADRFEWKPMLGSAAPHDLPLTLQVTHVGRGELAALGAVRREQHELRVDYVRPEFVERLEILREGLKQSFVFSQLPPGEGDLVVRARLSTELQLQPGDGRDGLRFCWPGAGGAHIHQVVGIDAAGRRSPGTLRCDGDTLEFVLPSEFVANATLPLVLDPLIAPVVIVSSSTADERDADVAFLGAPINKYAVVYRRVVSATNNDTYVTFVSNAGAVTATLIIESLTGTSSNNPRVAGSDVAGNWFATWDQNGDVVGRLLVPNGAGSSLTLANTAGVESQAVVSGGLRGGGTRVFVGWRNSTTDQLFGCEVDIAANPPLKVATQTLVNDAGLFTQLTALALPRESDIKKLLLAYTTVSTVTGQTATRGLFFDSATPSTILGSSFAIAGSTNTSALTPAVAGDGRNWVVAYRTSSTILGNGAACNAVHQNGNAAVLSASRSLVTLGTTVNDIDVSWCGESAWVVMSRANGAAHDVLLTSIDPLNCADCEGLITVDTAGNDAAVAVTGAAATSTGAIVWVPISSAQGNISLARFAANDGSQTTLANGSFGETVTATCARVARADFGVELHGAVPNAATFALLATSRIDASCGGGATIVPDLFGGFVVTLGNTNGLGDARLQFAIPNVVQLSGLSLYVQFATLGSACFSAFDLSNALQVTIH